MQVKTQILAEGMADFVRAVISLRFIIMEIDSRVMVSLLLIVAVAAWSMGKPGGQA